MTDDPLDEDYLIQLAASRAGSRSTFDYVECPRCRHVWHGMPCQTTSAACTCPTSREEQAS